MARVALDSQGLLVGGRRAWMVGAALEYSLLEPVQWPRAASLLRQTGFNTVRTSVPWSLHEPRRGQRRFDGSLDVRRFIERCTEIGLWTIVRVGPSIGGTFSGGGVPSWLSEIDGLRIREPQEEFLKLVSGWYDAVLSEIKGFAASSRGSTSSRAGDGGGIVAIQIEHGWNCGNAAAGAAYLRQLRRLVREAGIEVPILTANGLWTTVDETIEIWEGSEDLFSHARQLRQVQPGAPVIVEVSHGAIRRRRTASAPTKESAGDSADDSADDSRSDPPLVVQVAASLAAGSQPIVAHAGAEVHRSAPAGTDELGALAMDSVIPQVVAHSGDAAMSAEALAPLVLFASRFGSILSGNGGNDAIVLDPDARVEEAPIILSRSASGGAVAFILRPQQRMNARSGARARRPSPRATTATTITLVTSHGWKLPVALGASAVTWAVVDLDLGGRARLDYSALAPIELIDHSMLILRGVAGTRAPLSIGGSELIVDVPGADAGAKPLIVAHAGMTLVICNEAQAATIRRYGRGVTIGASSIAADGSVERATGFSEAVRLESGAGLQVVKPSTRDGSGAMRHAARARITSAIGSWFCAGATELVEGSSDRFASIEQPRSLAAYAPSSGLGWYRLRFRARAGSKLWLPGASASLRLFLDGEAFASIGDGDRFPRALPAGRRDGDDRVLSILAVDRGRPIHGPHQARMAGVGRGAWSVQALRFSTRRVPVPSFDPFSHRAFVPGAPGAAAESALELQVRTAPKKPIILDFATMFAGAVLVNGALVDMVEADRGSIGGVVIEPPARSSNRSLAITLVPLQHRTDLEKAVALWELEDELGSGSRGEPSWSFARWEPPPRESTEWRPWRSGRASPQEGRRAASRQRLPAWWRTIVSAGAGASLSLDGLRRGVILLDGEIAGHYDALSQPHLPLATALEGAELIVFDEEGASPERVRVVDAE